MHLRLKVLELHNSECDVEFLIVDEDASVEAILCEDDAAYAVCGDRGVADLFVRAVHAMPQTPNNTTTKPQSEVH